MRKPTGAILLSEVQKLHRENDSLKQAHAAMEEQLRKLGERLAALEDRGGRWRLRTRIGAVRALANAA